MCVARTIMVRGVSRLAHRESCVVIVDVRLLRFG